MGRRILKARRNRRSGADASGRTTGTRRSVRVRFTTYLLRHAQVFFSSLGRLSRAPVSSLLTACVIGIALALPSGLYLLLKNLQQVSAGWDGDPQLSVFLASGISDAQALELAERLRGRDDIGAVRAMSRAQTLDEFQRLSGFGDALKALDENPLPAVLVIEPKLTQSVPEAAAQRLLEALRKLPEVELAQLDMQWVKRLYTLMEIAKRGVLVVASLLAAAVLLIIGNTVRLEIENRRKEIEITKLVGATNAFIRRPFLYTGLWYGLLGGLLAWLLTGLSLGLLSGPVERLAGLYHSGFALSGLDIVDAFSLLAISAVLGLLGSWLSVGRHLRAIEPS